MRCVLFLAFLVPILGQDDIWWPGGDCGRSKYADAGENQPSNSGFSTQIVGGITARDNEFPWSVSIQGSGVHFCGGTLISDQWILTTGDCVLRINNTQNNVKVVVGSVLLNTPAPTEMQYDIGWATPHELFTGNCDNCPTPFDFDIGLIKTATPVTISDDVRPACAPSVNETYFGVDMQIMGYGSTGGVGGSPSNTLQYTSVSRLSEISCDQEYQGVYNLNYMTFCAMQTAGEIKDGCEWDTGSSVVYKRPDARFVVPGAITYIVRSSRCDSARPGLFMNATHDNFHSWVTTKIEKN